MSKREFPLTEIARPIPGPNGRSPLEFDRAGAPPSLPDAIAVEARSPNPFLAHPQSSELRSNADRSYPGSLFVTLRRNRAPVTYCEKRVNNDELIPNSPQQRRQRRSFNSTKSIESPTRNSDTTVKSVNPHCANAPRPEAMLCGNSDARSPRGPSSDFQCNLTHQFFSPFMPPANHVEITGETSTSQETNFTDAGATSYSAMRTRRAK